ncbi:MAG: methylenetetrahydrofolate reductase [Oligoflexia bacterium]|nr:methylenetetrahydrofolate reductase [Oligoflexia bacterium]
MSVLKTTLEAGKKVITAEVTPPHGTDIKHFLDTAKILKSHVHALNVTDNQRALMRMSGLACCARLVQEGIEPVFQLTCRDRNILAIQSDLLGAQALGIKNILALTGDPVSAGDTPDAKGVFQVEAVGLLNLINKLNSGFDLNNKELTGKLELFPGAAVNPGGRSYEPQLKRMEKKMKAGAKFFQTQIVFDRLQMENFMKAARPTGAKIIAGILLVRSLKTARFLHDKVPGIFVTDELFKHLEEAKDQEQAGLEYTAKLAKEYFDMCDGVHLIAIKAEEKLIDVLKLSQIKKG